MAAVDDPGLGDAHARIARQLRVVAAGCRDLGSGLYGDLLLHAADDAEARGPTAEVLADFLDQGLASGVAFRLLGGVHAIVLSGRAPDLAAFYPSSGGVPDAQVGSPLVWGAFRQTLIAHKAEVRSWLDRTPQTNEVGRAAALLGGLRHIAAEAALPLRLVEVGASAGLNLRADHFHVPGQAGDYGDTRSPVVLTNGWQGHAPPVSKIEVAERIGGDIAPVDPMTEDGRLQLMAYVWPDQTERLGRLRGALQIAAQVPVDMRAESATATLARTTLVPGTWTVLWHSTFRQYLNETQRADLVSGVAELGRAATAQARFAYLYSEQSRAGGCRVVLTTWPGERLRVLGTAAEHGLPVRWELSG